MPYNWALLKLASVVDEAAAIPELPVPTITVLDVRDEPPTVVPPDANAYAEPVVTLPSLSITKGVVCDE